MLINANLLTSDQPLSYLQADLPTFRVGIAKEIILGKCEERRQSGSKQSTQLTADECEAIDYLEEKLNESESMSEMPSVADSAEIEGGMSSEEESKSPIKRKGTERGVNSVEYENAA